MSEEFYHKIPHRDQVTGGKLFISELTSEDGSVQIRGKFEVPLYARLDKDQADFLEAFLRCRGIISCVERELGMSYPTVRARLDALLAALELAPAKEDSGKTAARRNLRVAILEDLESGKITAQEAKEKLRGGKV